MQTSSRFVLLAAVALSSFSVGLSLVAVGCRTSVGDAALASRAEAPASATAATRAPPAPARAQLAASPAPARSDGASVSVARLVVSADVLEREPVLGAPLLAGQPITAFLELRNGGRADAVRVTFEHGGTRVGHVKLAVPAATQRYRTWATTRQVSAPGTWEAVVRSADGLELARASFDVAAGPATLAAGS